MYAGIGKHTVQLPELGHGIFHCLMNVSTHTGIPFRKEKPVGAVQFGRQPGRRLRIDIHKTHIPTLCYKFSN